MKKIATSVADFGTLRNERNHYLYVDKTEYIWNLVCADGEKYLLTRPRRFGKTLTVSILENFFQGNREPFRGLAIDSKDYDWPQYPVIHFDLGGFAYNSVQDLEDALSELVKENACKYKVELEPAPSALMFRRLLRQLATGNQRIVLLIDEYDKPIMRNLETDFVLEIQSKLRDFYGIIKSFEQALRFVFVTGVAKFSRTSFFSDLNNLRDISMVPEYATMLGYTQEEFEANFGPHIDQACEIRQTSRQDLIAKIREWYNGFRFNTIAPKVYNPLSLALFFKDGSQFNNYWSSTGIPTFFVKKMKENKIDLQKVLTDPIGKNTFDPITLEKLNEVALMVQAGYLTISDRNTDPDAELLYLDFPNKEVRDSFNDFLVTYFTPDAKDDVNQVRRKFLEALAGGNILGFMERLEEFLAGISCNIRVDPEGRFQLTFYMVFAILHGRTYCESKTSDGSIDAVVITDKHIYLFEFKRNRTAEIALKQIYDQQYFLKYRGDGKKICIIGVNYDSKKRRITSWIAEELHWENGVAKGVRYVPESISNSSK